MTEALIERFRAPLESLEKQRLKIVHDRKAILFIIFIVVFLTLACLFAGLLGPSRGLALFGVALGVGCAVLVRARSRLDIGYQRRFREEFTRPWFQAAYPGCYLAPAPSAELPLEVQRSLREACIRATAQMPSLTTIEERVFFDTDSYHSWSFILRERRRFSRRIRSRAIVWFRASGEDSARVAFAWPPLGLSREPDVRAFENGRPVPIEESLRAKLVSLYERLRARSDGQDVRVSLSPTGAWAGVRLKDSFFEAPLLTSALDIASYKSWSAEARLPADREIVSFLFTI